MFKIKWQLSGAVSLAAILAAGPGNAQSSNVTAEQIDRLQSQIEILQRELKSVKSKVTSAEQAYAAAPAADTVPSSKSLCPPTYLVNACMLTSTPCANASKSTPAA